MSPMVSFKPNHYLLLLNLDYVYIFFFFFKEERGDVNFFDIVSPVIELTNPH